MAPVYGRYACSGVDYAFKCVLETLCLAGILGVVGLFVFYVVRQHVLPLIKERKQIKNSKVAHVDPNTGKAGAQIHVKPKPKEDVGAKIIKAAWKDYVKNKAVTPQLLEETIA